MTLGAWKNRDRRHPKLSPPTARVSPASPGLDPGFRNVETQGEELAWSYCQDIDKSRDFSLLRSPGSRFRAQRGRGVGRAPQLEGVCVLELLSTLQVRVGSPGEVQRALICILIAGNIHRERMSEQLLCQITFLQ